MTAEIELPKSSYSNGKISLDKIHLPDAHIVHGREFPVAYSLNLYGKDYDNAEIDAFVTKLSKEGIFTQLFENHGALVLRGLIPDSDDTKVDEAASFIKAIEENRGQVQFQQNGTLLTRSKKGFNLYTASESPPEFRLLQHNEYSRFKRYPNSLIFTILEFTAIGGETPLVHGAELFEKVKNELPQFLDKLSKVGLKFEDETWYKDDGSDKLFWNHEVTFGRNIKKGDDLETQKKKALELATEYISENARFNENDDLVISSLTKPVKDWKSEPLLFSSLGAFTQRYNPDKPAIKYGDGTLFDLADLEKYKKISNDLEYKHAWESGDIVFIHNYQVSHGKLPYSGGKRSTLVGMWDTPDITSQPLKDHLV